MAKVVLIANSSVITAKGERINLESGEQEVTAEVEKVLTEAGLIEKPKPKEKAD